MFGYLKLHPKRKISFDAAHPSIDERRVKKYDWYDFYRGAKESIPLDCPEPSKYVEETLAKSDKRLTGRCVAPI